MQVENPSKQQPTFCIKRIILFLIMFTMAGCCKQDKKGIDFNQRKIPPKPPQTDQSISKSTKISVPEVAPLKTKITTNSEIDKKLDKLAPSPYAVTISLKKEILTTFRSGKYTPTIAKKLIDYWEVTSYEQKDELLAFLAQNPVLLRSELGLKPWSIRNFLSTLQTSAKEDLLMLKYLKQKSGSVQPDLRSYLTSKYKKNLGGNTILWKKLIQKNVQP